MPWPEKQRIAIFLETKRRKGLAAAKRLMDEAGEPKRVVKRRRRVVRRAP